MGPAVTAMLGGFIALQVGDGLSTIAALRCHALGEGDPIARRLFDRVGIVPAIVGMKAAAIGAAVAVTALARNEAVPLASLAIGCSFYGWAVADNCRLVLRHAAPDSALARIKAALLAGRPVRQVAGRMALAVTLATILWACGCAFLILEPHAVELAAGKPSQRQSTLSALSGARVASDALAGPSQVRRHD